MNTDLNNVTTPEVLLCACDAARLADKALADAATGDHAPDIRNDAMSAMTKAYRVLHALDAYDHDDPDAWNKTYQWGAVAHGARELALAALAKSREAVACWRDDVWLYVDTKDIEDIEHDADVAAKQLKPLDLGPWPVDIDY